MDRVERMVSAMYLGDRALKSLTIDGWDRHLAFQVTSVSRIRQPGEAWDFYIDEDIENALIVLDEITFFSIEPPGKYPNDLIRDFRVSRHCDNTWEFLLRCDHVDTNGQATQVIVRVHGQNVHLLDPTRDSIEVQW